MVTHHLPAPLTSFIGRTHELREIDALLADPACRLLTLVGPGGIGKTRLALEVVRPLTFADGIYCIDLQPVSTNEVLITTIASALGMLLSGPQDPREQLLNYLSTHEMLLLLDNFEQLLDSIDLLSDMMRSAPNIKLLLTSRVALNLQEEWVWQVGGLQVPQIDADVASSSAVQLFTERARRIRQDFTLAGQESHIVRTCQLVEGMPLALELAASWTKALSCAEIADEIQHSLNFLTTPMRNMPERHRNMQAVFDHSWRLLTDEERAVFAKLSVFLGGFRREAAEQVADASLAVLAGLVDKSFLRMSAAGRYTVHELMRQYGDENLDSVDRTATQNRRCIYYAGFLHQRQALLHGPQQAGTLAEIEHELDNVRASWMWAVEHDMRNEIHQAMDSLFMFCHIRAQAIEGERLFDMAVRRFEHEDNATFVYLFWARMFLAAWNGRSVGADQIPRMNQLAHTFWKREEIVLPLTASLYNRHVLLREKLLEDRHHKQVYLDFLDCFKSTGQHWGAGWALYGLGELFRLNEEWDDAERYFKESRQVFKQIGDRWSYCRPTDSLALVFIQIEKYREANRLCQEQRDIYQEIGDSGGAVVTYVTQAQIAWKMKDHVGVKQCVTQGIKMHLESRSHFTVIIFMLEVVIDVFVNEGRHERAIELLIFLRQRSHKAGVSDFEEHMERLDVLEKQTTPDIYQHAVERGKTLNLRTILSQLQAELLVISPTSSAAMRNGDSLTERELEVLCLIAAGRNNRQIAHDLFLTLGTVKSHIHHIYGKLSVKSRTQAIARAKEQRLI